jgi:thioredoxin-related protein
MLDIQHDLLKSIDADKIDHKIGLIVGQAPCQYCNQVKSKFRAESGKVYCNKLHQELDEK